MVLWFWSLPEPQKACRINSLPSFGGSGKVLDLRAFRALSVFFLLRRALPLSCLMVSWWKAQGSRTVRSDFFFQELAELM